MIVQVKIFYFRAHLSLIDVGDGAVDIIDGNYRVITLFSIVMAIYHYVDRTG